MHPESPPPARDPRPRVWTVFLGFVIALVGIMVLTSVLLIGLFMAQRAGSSSESMEFETILTDFVKFSVSPVALLASGAASSLSLLCASLIGARLGGPALAARLRTGKSRLGWGRTALAAAGAIVLGQVGGIVIQLLSLDKYGALKLFGNAILQMGPGLLVIAVLVIGIGAPIGEELFFRGYIQTRLSQRWRPGVAIFVTALLFGFLHLDPIQGSFALLMGLYLGYLTERSGSIRPAIFGHAANNCFSVLFGWLMRKDAPDAPDDTPLSLSLVMLFGAAAVFGVILYFLREREAKG